MEVVERLLLQSRGTEELVFLAAFGWACMHGMGGDVPTWAKVHTYLIQQTGFGIEHGWGCT